MDRDFHEENATREQLFGRVNSDDVLIREQHTLSPDFETAQTDGVQRDHEAQQGSSNVSRGAFQRRRVCALDDSYKNMRAIFRALKKDGHEVDHFLKPSDAIIALEGGSYNALIVSDTACAGAAECDFLIARLRQSGRQEFAELTIVALTSDESDERRKALYDAGASRVLGKFTSRELSEAVIGVAAKDVGATTLDHHKRVLLLEDSYSLSQRLSDALMSVGHEVDHVATADEALVLARSCRHDVIVLAQCDSGSLTCEQLLDQLRALKSNFDSNTPIAVLVASADAQNEKSLRLAGADLVLARDADQLEFHLISWIQRTVLGAQSKSADELPTLRNVISTEYKLASVHAHGEVSPPREQLDMQPAWLIEPRRHSTKAVAPRRRVELRDWFSTIRVLAILTLVAISFWFGRSFMVDGAPTEQSTANTGEHARSIAVHGQVMSKRQIDLPATQMGQIYRVYVQEGRLVRKGEKLATLDNREAVINVRRAEAQVFRYRTEIDFAERTLRELQAEGPMVASKQMVRDVQEGKASAEAKLLVAEQDLRSAQLAVEHLAIVAPFAGVTVRCYAIEGRWVEPGAPLYMLADLNALEMALRLDAENAHSFQNIHVGQTVRFSTNGTEWTERVLRVSSDSDFFAATNAPGRIFDGNTVAAYSSLGEDAPALELDAVVTGAIVLELMGDSRVAPSAHGTQRSVSGYLKRIGAPVNIALASIGKRIRIE